MTTHELKSWPEYFAMVAAGEKTFELRKNDRVFKVGDKLVLEEFRPGVGEYSGRTQSARVVYMIDSRDTVGMDGLRDGYCILGIKLV